MADEKGDTKCAKCGKPVDPSHKITAKDLTFHLDHFRCSKCDKSLSDGVYGYNDGKFFCQEDYYATYGKKCQSCTKMINGTFVTHGGRYWCSDHFNCYTCKEKFTSDTHYEYEGQVYCETCYSKITTHTCRICDKTIDHRALVMSLGYPFHLDCFVCCVGDHKIGDKNKYYEHKGKLYCKGHWDEADPAGRCLYCFKSIEHDYVKVSGKQFHTACWKCNCCKEVIKGRTALHIGGVFYCITCGKDGEKRGIKDWDKLEGIIGKRLIRGYGEYEAAPGTVPPWESKTYPLEVLLLRPPEIPKEIDFRQREQYLDEDVFKEVFKTDMRVFNAYPLWRRMLMKKEVGLF